MLNILGHFIVFLFLMDNLLGIRAVHILIFSSFLPSFSLLNEHNSPMNSLEYIIKVEKGNTINVLI